MHGLEKPHANHDIITFANGAPITASDTPSHSLAERGVCSGPTSRVGRLMALEKAANAGLLCPRSILWC